jgi:predicted GNAT family acetyltransferase
MTTEETQVINQPTSGRFEIGDEGGLGHLEYVVSDGLIRLLHTEVPPSQRGKGHGDRLARAALEYARGEGLRVSPLCPFVAKYIDRHPEYKGLVDNEGTDGPRI